MVFQHGQWFRIVTAIFLHQDIVHLTLNGVVMFFAGLYLEKRIGHLWLLALFLAGGIAGAFMSLVLNPSNTSSVGASGAIMGMLAAILFASFAAAGRREADAATVRRREIADPSSASQRHRQTHRRRCPPWRRDWWRYPGVDPAFIMAPRRSAARQRWLASAIVVIAVLFLPIGVKSGIAMAFVVRGDAKVPSTDAATYYDRAIALDPTLASA